MGTGLGSRVVALIDSGCVWTKCFIGVSTARWENTILETCWSGHLCSLRGCGWRAWQVSHPVGVLRQYVSEPGHAGTFTVCGHTGVAGVLFEICIVCVSVFVSI